MTDFHKGSVNNRFGEIRGSSDTAYLLFIT